MIELIGWIVVIAVLIQLPPIWAITISVIILAARCR